MATDPPDDSGHARDGDPPGRPGATGALPSAPAELLEAIYRELRALAAHQLRRRSGQASLEPTALVHEAWLRLMAGRSERWEDRSAFFASAARAMRDILVERARRTRAAKRGGGRTAVELGLSEPVALDDPAGLLALDEALRRLEQASPPAAEVVLLRVFAGLTVAETAAALDCSPSGVDRRWAFAKAWLQRELSG